MKEGNYLISIRILEASDLIPVSASGVVNPYCVVSVMNKYDKTKTSNKTLSPLWDHNFVFEFSNLKKGDLETAKITFEVFSREYYVFTESIGKYEIDLSSVYFNKYHQFYMTWFALADPEDLREGCQGYVKANIDVLGPDDKPHVNEKITEDSVAQTVVSNKIRQDGHLIIAELYRAEHLAPVNMTKNALDAFVSINYGGVERCSSTITAQNPVWNEILYLQAMLPNHSKNLQIALWNHNPVMDNDLIGTCLIPFNCFRSLLELPPMWVNIYGPPLCGVGEIAEQMAIHGFKSGSCYRGRILMRFSSMLHDNPKSRLVPMAFRMPEMLVPNPPTKSYFLRVDVYSGQELPGTKGMLHFSIGPYLKKTKSVERKHGIFNWEFECVEFSRVLLPIDIMQIPDLIVYFADEDYESHRKCFIRINPVSILSRTRRKYAKKFQSPRLIKFREDQTLDLVPDDQFSGFAVIRPVLFAYDPPERTDFSGISKTMKEYVLKMFFYVGRNLPSAKDGGVCNPVIVIRVANQVLFSSIKQSTLNPEWYEVREKEIKTFDIQNQDSPALAVVVLLYHVENPDTPPEEIFAEQDEDKVEENPANGESQENIGIMGTAKKYYNKGKGMIDEFQKKKKVLLGRFWLEEKFDKKKIYKDNKTGKE